MLRDLVYKFLSPLVAFLLERKFAITAEVPEEVKLLEPPYLLFSNHQAFWDPVMINLYLPRDVRFITTDAMFRSPFSRVLMNFLGAVPKRKARTDMNTMKQIIYLKETKRVIGIFPEGQKTWDGVSLPLLFTTAKLVKKLAIPVVTVRIRGGYLSHPRWSVSRRRGRVELHYRLLYQDGEAGASTAEEIHGRLTDELFHDAVEWQRKVLQPFRGKRRAERLEQLLYLCPGCFGVGTLVSRGNDIRCSRCDSGWSYNELGFLEELPRPGGNEAGAGKGTGSTEGAVSEPRAASWAGKPGAKGEDRVVYDNLRDWNRWQRRELQGLLASCSEGKVILEERGLALSIGPLKGPWRRLPGKVHMRLLFTPAGGAGEEPRWVLQLSSAAGGGRELLEASVGDLQGVNIQNREILEFSCGESLYSLRDRGRRFSAWKWLVALEYLQG